jgi:O-methyltransferase
VKNSALSRLRAASTLAARAMLVRDRESKENLRHMFASKVVDFMGGYQLYKRTHAWIHDPDFLRVWQAYAEGDAHVRDRRFSLYQLARSVAGLSGDTVECGVWRGAGSYLICKATEGQGRIHHVFDSFEGLSSPTAQDSSTDTAGHLWKNGEFATPLSVVQSNLSAFDVKYYQGWIPDRFAEVADKKFSFVHLNVNLEEPTRASLEFFYDRIVRGGMLVCHDYGFIDTPGARHAFDEFIADKPEQHVVHLTSGQGIVVKR